MVREFGSPTFFLTFSCPEYESPEIDAYLRKVNNVSEKYPIAKLCVEDPVSVSRKFSQKFRNFFNTVLIKGEVLGKVTHHFWKKEYQARGAPHYHVLLWIADAPVIGKHSSKDVLSWILGKITCHIPNERDSPELYRLVTKYQLHKCSNYCKRTRKYGTAVVAVAVVVVAVAVVAVAVVAVAVVAVAAVAVAAVAARWSSGGVVVQPSAVAAGHCKP